ncbi:conserved hypothetical protein [Histoplasma capsulatum var. duboisii H88]|uniref:Uncharacterized protein n=1 Tax=Ajellomyces capsulatus (strain H88) TaxID=544711 RepID=F0UP54_AJEC8|nr:conserved hypothetical protein [Histoplasma capsulatum var. duboisii H88]
MGTCLSDAIQAAHTLEDSAREGIPADNILNVDNMAKTAVDTGSIFKPSSFFTRDATIAALESIVRCWAPTSGLIPTEDLKRWYKGLSGNEITALSTLAWHFGSDEVGLSEICSFISFHPDDAGGLENIWGVEFQDFCRFRVFASHHEGVCGPTAEEVDNSPFTKAMQISKNIFPNRIPALHIPKAPNFTFKFPRTRDSQQHVQPINENGIADILLAVQPSKKDISGVMK